MGGKTIKYRLQVPLEERTRKALNRLAEVTDSSMGKTAGTYLDELAPQFEAIAQAIEQVKSDPHASAAGLQLLLAQAQRDALEAQTDMFQAISELPRKGTTDSDSDA